MMHITTAPSGVTVHSQVPFHAPQAADTSDLAFLALSYSLWGKKLIKGFAALLP